MTYGTLGGFLELKDPLSGTWREFGLTCFHCVVPGAGGSGSSKSAGSIGQRLAVEGPSRRGIQAGVNELTESIAALERYSHNYRPSLKLGAGSDANVDVNVDADYDLRMYKEISRQIRALEKPSAEMRDYLDSGKNVLGTVFAAFRSRLRHDMDVQLSARNGLANGTAPAPAPAPAPAMDWALIRPSPGRTCGENDFAKRSDIIDRDCIDFIRRHRNIDPGTRLFKLGCATGSTWGFYNGLRTAMIGREHTEEAITMEHTVVYNREGRGVSYAKGDDGALVYSYIGLVVGMLVGGQSNGDIAYFSDIHDVLDHIQEVTGVEEVRMKGSGDESN
ncbi:hypothetical protein BDW74DRAFT_178831 [Aspergillus multicolor]|uniref:uncharacterized protein n=1 Tax=Aspergillus multicolor TaxID=41759 RepID=UPI003CCC942D